jgi:hemolysin III
MPLIPGLSKYYKSHTKHHALTPVVYRKAGIKNRYPIIEEQQHEASFFPWYSYLVFVLILTPLFGFVQWIFPTIPIFLAGSLALAFSLSLYELVHAMEHYPLEKWLPKLEHPNLYLRKFWRTVYSFHLRHHVDKKCNECISGFFAIPVADFLFGTWVNPNVLYEDGTQVDKKEFEPPVPGFFIRMLDDLAERVIDNRRKRKVYP